ncbi:MAG TPA: glycosyl hydrolase [Actinomycetota bacterium]
MARRTMIVIAILTAMTIPTITHAAPAEAARKRILFGAYVPPAPHEGMGAVTDVERQIGAKLDTILFYQAWGGGHAAFDASWVNAAGTSNRNVYLTWEPWRPGEGANQPDYSLASILSGRHDDYIRSWARGVKTVGKLVYLRPMHEMNGNWYPWGGGVNGNTAAQYVQTWRKIVGMFRAEGVKNARWIWSPYSVDVPSTNRFEAFYPGSSYVDVVAIDGYNWGACEPTYGGWQSFDQVFAGAYSRVMKMGTRRPIWIGETAAPPEGGDKAKWIADMFKVLKTAKYQYVSAVTWFSTNKECDWRMTSPASAVNALAQSLAAR